jgi:hypothetical protein
MQPKHLFAAVAVAALLAPALAFAQVGASVNASVTTGDAGASVRGTVSADAITNAKARADQEIDRRTTSLQALLARINAMARVDASFKATLATTIQNQITALANLKATIDADSTLSTLKVEVQSITKSYRIYALVMPQASISAAADRVQTIAGLMTTLSGKLSARIASSTTVDAAASAALTDANAKIADAQVQATAAIGHISGLQPDNGDKTTMAANLAALKLARADIRVAQQDFVAARKDFTTILNSLHVSASATSSASVQTQ